jgi:hypothetical protein
VAREIRAENPTVELTLQHADKVLEKHQVGAGEEHDPFWRHEQKRMLYLAIEMLKDKAKAG